MAASSTSTSICSSSLSWAASSSHYSATTSSSKTNSLKGRQPCYLLQLKNTKGKLIHSQYGTFVAPRKFPKRQIQLFASTEDDTSNIEFMSDASEQQKQYLDTEDLTPESDAPIYFEGSVGKPGFISFYGRFHEKKEEYIELPLNKHQPILIWFIGPSVLVASFIFPSLYLRRILSSIFEDSLLTGLIPGPDNKEDFTVEAKKVIDFAKLHPRTKRQFLKPHLGDNVEFLFPDNLGSSTPRNTMTVGDQAPQVTSLVGRKRRVTSGNQRVVRSNTGASASDATSPAIMSSTSPSLQQSSAAHISSLAVSNQTAIGLTAFSSQVLSSPMTHSSGQQISTFVGVLPSRLPREGAALWKPQFKDLQGKLLTISHTGRDNTPVAGLVENNSILPLDVEFFDCQSSAYLILNSAQNRYNANAADHTIGNRLLRYEDYINNICTSLGVSRHDSILNRLNGLKAEVDKARAVNNKVADLQSSLDKAKAIIAVSQSEVETLRADKEKALKELEAKEMELATERSLKEKAEATVAAWKPNYDLLTEKMLALFDCVVPHLEVCQPFRADVRPFWAKYEPADLANFDQEIAGITGDAAVQSPLVDKALVSQSDDLVNISEAERREATYTNPYDPAGDN